MNILITGGAGAVGTNLVKYSMANSDHIYVVDDISSGFKNTIDAPNVSYHFLDVADPTAMTFLKDKRIDYIFHLAALFANQRSLLEPEIDLMTSGVGTLNVLRFAANVKVKKLVFTSSSSIYKPVTGPIREDFINSHPTTPYAASKLIAEQYLRIYSHNWGVPVGIVRIFNSYGPYEYPGEFRNVIPNFISRAIKGEPLRITGSGLEYRDFTYVEDVVCALWKIAEHNSHFLVVNVGTGKKTFINELAMQIKELTESSSEIQYTTRRNWDQTEGRKADINYVKSVLDFEPKVNLRDGLQKTVDWIRSITNT